MFEQIIFHTAALIVLCFSLAGDTWSLKKEGPIKLTRTGWGSLIAGVSIFLFSLLFDYQKDRSSQQLKDVVYLPLIVQIDDILSREGALDDQDCRNLRETYTLAQELITKTAGNEINAGIMLGSLGCSSAHAWNLETTIFLTFAIQNLCADSPNLQTLPSCLNWLKTDEEPMKFEFN